jgi:hypothetical protein
MIIEDISALLLRSHRRNYPTHACGEGSKRIALKHLLISVTLVPMIATITSTNLGSSTTAGAAAGIGFGPLPPPTTITSRQKVRLIASSTANPAKSAAVSLVVHPMIRPVPPGEIVSLSVSPGSAALNCGQTATFTANVSGTSDTHVTWSLSPQVGVIAQGVYHAPTIIEAQQTVMVTAKSLADPTVTASATVFLQLVRLTIGPASVSLDAGQSTTFTASVTGSANTAVAWSLSPQVGAITNGVYQAPAIIPNQQNVTVTTTSEADPTKTANATVALIPVGVTVGPAFVSLGAGASATFAASVTGTSNTAVTWSLSSAVGTVVNGVYTAPAMNNSLYRDLRISGHSSVNVTQIVTLTAASVADSTKAATATIALTPTLANLPNTPHFGNDGAQLTSYVPGMSMFVRSLFFSRVSDLAQYVTAFKAAGINTVEGGFYVPPGNSFSSATQWETAFNAANAGVPTAINDGFNLIFTGDDIARGSTAVYDAVSGPSTAWSPDPITYAFTWLKGLGKTIGVEMVDEISSQFAVPFPQGQLGVPNGPTQIACVSDVCAVTWPSPLVIENGDLTFLITGAISNANLNRAMPDLYHQNAGFSNGFTFNTTGVGTQTFTASTDPNLTFQMLASPGALGPSGTDYIHNDAISQLMAYINAVPGRPSVTWPAAAAAPGPNFGAWGGPGASDYGDIYFTYLGCNGPGGVCLPNDALSAFNYAWNAKYPYAQKDKPVLMEVGDYGLSYNIVGVPLPVTTFDGNTLVFSQPHGITAATVGLTRLSLSGNSNSALSGNYYVYAVTNPTTVEVYPASPSGPTTQGGAVTFADGQSVNLTVFPTQGSLSPHSMQMNGGPYCLHAADFAQLAVVSNSSYATYNGNWFVFPSSFDGLDANDCTWTLNMTPITVTAASSGGTSSLIADNYYHPGVSTLTAPATTPDNTAANIMYAAEQGAAGVRVYMFGSDANQDQALSSCFANCNTHINPNPIYNGPEAQATWQGLSNAFNLIDEIEPFLLQPHLPPPNYGPTMITAARMSSYGTLLLMTEFANTPQVVTVDLSPYNPSGGTGTMYTMSGEELNQQSVSGTSAQITFAPAETVAFTFPAGN